MAELIQLRRRIKVIETIKKITHAMRLIAMSTHSQLKNQQKPLLTYRETLESLFIKIKKDLPTWHHPLLNPTEQAYKELIIIIGSQKGLCGSFNHYLFKFIDRTRESWQKPYDLITIGPKATEYAKKFQAETQTVIQQYSVRTLTQTTHLLAQHLNKPDNPYRRITIYSNRFQSFFVQRPSESVIVPFAQNTTVKEMGSEEYWWPETPQKVLDELVPQYVESSLYYYLFESLFAEQAARFLSMDTATRNAQGLLDATKLAYNKLRQAKITKELIELTGSFT